MSETRVDMRNGARTLILLAVHGIVFAAAYALAYLLRFDLAIPTRFLPVFLDSMPLVVGVQLIVGAFFGFYRAWWRYVGIHDVVRLVAGLSTAQLILLVFWFAASKYPLVSRLDVVSRGALLIDWALALLILFGIRVGLRLLRDRTRRDTPANGTSRVLILGAGDAGEALLREIQHRPQLGMKVSGFLDDLPAKWNRYIRGVPVLGPIDKVVELADEHNVTQALIAMPSAPGKRIREIVRLLDEGDLEFKTIPGVDQLVQGRVHISQLRQVNIEDLIRRERIDLPGDPVRELFRGARVLITGAGGTIGSELASQILDFEPAHLALVERSEFALYEVDKRLNREKKWLMTSVSRHLADIQHSEVVRHIFETIRPEIVLHAAAHKHVPLGEENPAEYARNNTLATLELAKICCSFNVERFLFISTDKAINPTSVMGATKRAAEIALLDFASRSKMRTTIVRFGNVLGSSGSVVPLFMEQIASGGPVTVTHPEMTRYFLRQSEAISLVLQAATLGDDCNIFMLDMGEPIRIAALARDLIRLSGDDQIEIKFTGMRPGEKLYEEVRLASETTAPTVHPQIVVTKTAQPNAVTVNEFIGRLASAAACAESSASSITAVLATFIPEYSLPESQASIRGESKPQPGGLLLGAAGKARA